MSAALSMKRPETLLWPLLVAAACAHGADVAKPPAASPGMPPDPASISVQLLPAGAARNLVVRACGICHPIDLVVAQRRTQDEWDQLIARMVDHGAKASEDEQQLIFEYLVTNFGKN
jgi:hypothetical protein